MLRVKIRKVGTSLVVSLPAQIMSVYNIEEGDYFKFEITKSGTFELTKEEK